MERRLAWAVIGVVVLIAIATQPLSTVLAHHYLPQLAVLQEGAATYTQWTEYAQRAQAPDVLVIGDSRAATDVDVGALEQELSARAGRPVTVDHIGINGADSNVLRGLVYRVEHLPSRPRVILYAVTEFAFNANYQRDFTADYWQMGEPFDPGYWTLALQLDPYRDRLARGVLLPVFANYPIIARGVGCQWYQLRNPQACRPAASSQTDDEFLAHYRDFYLRDYRFSEAQLDQLRTAVQETRSSGTQVAVVVMPVKHLERVDPTDYGTFLDRLSAASNDLHVPFVDLHQELADEGSLWDDPLHLTAQGASLLAPMLAEASADELLASAQR